MLTHLEEPALGRADQPVCVYERRFPAKHEGPSVTEQLDPTHKTMMDDITPYNQFRTVFISCCLGLSFEV